MKAVEDCMNNPHPETFQMRHMFDVGAWVEGQVEEIHHHTKPHCFKFIRNEAGKAVMYYRKWSGEEWMGPIQMLKVDVRSNVLLLTIPYSYS